MKRFFSILLATLLIACSFSFVGCANQDGETTVLRICNCEDYIDETLLEKFEEDTGIKVEYSTFGTNENLYNELVINPNSYDLVVPSEYMIQKLAVEGRLNKLVHSNVPNYEQYLSNYIKGKLESITFEIEEGEYQGENANLSEFMVGYMWGTMGWVYNTKVTGIEDNVKTWYGPFENSSLNGKITIKDAVRDSYIVGLSMVYEQELYGKTNAEITQILNRTDKTSIKKVQEKLNSLKPMLYGFELDDGKNHIILGNIDAYVAWSGDAAYAIDVATGEVEDEDGNKLEGNARRSISYYIPEEGSNIWFDGLVMPAGSNNYDAVYKFLDFICDPENVCANMDYIGYTSVIASDEIFESIPKGWNEELAVGEGKEIDLSYFFGQGDYTITVSDEMYGRVIAQYPTEEIVNRCAVMEYFKKDVIMDINDMWEQVKGETFPTWLIILVAVLVVLIGIAIVIIRNKEKFSWLKLPENDKTYYERKGYKVIKKEDIL